MLGHELMPLHCSRHVVQLGGIFYYTEVEKSCSSLWPARRFEDVLSAFSNHSEELQLEFPGIS